MRKGKVNYIEVLFDDEDSGEDEALSPYEGDHSGEEPPWLQSISLAPLQDGAGKITIAALSGVSRYYNLELRAFCRNKESQH